MIATAQKRASLQVPRISRAWLRLFAFYNKRYLQRHFHRIRILKTGLPRILNQPTVVFLNHAAWWDPLVCLFLARRFFPDRASFAPIDAVMLERYRFFKRLGFFGVEQNSIFGAATFLRTSRALLASSQTILWVTPQGRFVDARERPLNFQTGLATLARRLPSVAFLPMAIEYSFWIEARPEILVSFGLPIMPGNRQRLDTDGWNQLLSRSLEDLQDELAMASCLRDPRDWLTMIHGHRGGNPAYEAIRHLRSWFRGRRFSSAHQLKLD
jgi:1-acyl-sn-glycerol-3-phosphate acyltransferase